MDSPRKFDEDTANRRAVRRRVLGPRDHHLAAELELEMVRRYEDSATPAFDAVQALVDGDHGE